MKKIKVGQIGKGSFGKKILSKLEKMSDVSVEWVYGSKNKWWESDVDLDWVIIVSPNEFHYEQAKYYLEKGVDVFCEKPGTLSLESLTELIELSKINDVCFYIDDVLTYEDILPISDFVFDGVGHLLIKMMICHSINYISR